MLGTDERNVLNQTIDYFQIRLSFIEGRRKTTDFAEPVVLDERKALILKDFSI
ncbi:hypothetical protein GBL_2506 [Geobacillus kaustophilus GBlys]|uniref:Uncharacterized protein n=1 Tax=Geobacillus kaustophilus GBlys TaxID=1337888 RepID=U2Y4T6_GEOKU|nr:hypothetical protein GBL_2506 [Geobacillus kaustophilus GBlys]